MNILNERAFMIFMTSGPCPVFVLNALAFRKFRTHSRYHEYPERKCIRDIQDAEKRRHEYPGRTSVQDIQEPP